MTMLADTVDAVIGAGTHTGTHTACLLDHLGRQVATITVPADPAAGTAAGIEAQIAQIAGDMTPGLVAAGPGPGALSAAQILLSWSHAGRIRSEAAFAMLPAPPRSPSPPAAPTATASTAPATASSTGH